jgi:hypothetical protein
MPTCPNVGTVSTRRAKRLSPVEDEESGFTAAQIAKLNSVEWGATAGGGGAAIDVEEDNSLVVSGAETLNFTGHVNVTPAGGNQADVEIIEDIDGGVF